MTGATRRLAEFGAALADTDIPSTARSRIVDAITDCLGCTLAGIADPSLAPLRSLAGISSVPRPGSESTVIGYGFAAPGEAALLNGAFAHVLDYDDFSHPAYSHPSVVLVPAMLAVAPMTSATGTEMVTAYAAGLQVYGKLGAALNMGHCEAGWHPTATFGALAAAVAAARLLRLGIDETASAIAIAASSAAGLRSNFGTPVKPLHAGQSARAGVMAALLARGGMTGAAEVLEGRFGFLAAYAGHYGVRHGVLDDWTTPLEVTTEFGLNLKPFPSCAATHTAIEAVQTLRRRLGVGPEDVEAVRVGASELAFLALHYDRPATSLEAKFSMPYCVAVALADETVALSSFSADRLMDPELTSILPKVTMERDPLVVDHPEMGSVVTVITRDGRTDTEQVMIARGKAGRWPTPEQQCAKFLDCVRAGGAGMEVAREWFGAFQRLDFDTPLAELLARLSEVSLRSQSST